jgi:hypothetical protein
VVIGLSPVLGTGGYPAPRIHSSLFSKDQRQRRSAFAGDAISGLRRSRSGHRWKDWRLADLGFLLACAPTAARRRNVPEAEARAVPSAGASVLLHRTCRRPCAFPRTRSQSQVALASVPASSPVARPCPWSMRVFKFPTDLYYSLANTQLHWSITVTVELNTQRTARSASSQHATRCAPRARGSQDRGTRDRPSRIQRRAPCPARRGTSRSFGPGPRAGPPATAAREERDESSYHESERSPGPAVEKMTGLAPHVFASVSVALWWGHARGWDGNFGDAWLI